ncbi:MAG: hypothetical protein BA869_02230 [Desulfuromonadales bacterium C00003107]|jgi:hypothetical protein|nr:MAG: hypothetical protein BA869_02230 [Desulfuromonadales bacterium C00003107]
MTKKKIGCLSVSILVLLLILGTCTGGLLSPLPYRHLDPFFGKVIDADTKEPIAGAAVLAVYYTEVYTIAGANSIIVDAQETLTDENGEFKIPKVKRWFTAVRGYARGKITIFKPGYGVFPGHARSTAGGESKTWPPPKKYIVYELPKLKTIKERKRNAIYVNTYHEIPYQKRKLYIKAINQECVSLGLPPNTIPNEEGQK